MDFYVNKEQLLKMLEHYMLTNDEILVDVMIELLGIIDKNEEDYLIFSISDQSMELVH